MGKTEILEALTKLSREEREEVRRRLAELDGAVGEKWSEEVEPLTDAEKTVLDSRLEAYENDPESGSSWEEVEARILAPLKR